MSRAGSQGIPGRTWMRERIVAWLVGSGLPPWIVPDYWFMLTAAIVAGTLVTLAASRRSKLAAPVSDLLFFGILGLFLGAKVLYGVQYWNSWSWERMLQPAGFALYGGLVGILTAWLVYRLVRPYPLWSFLDGVAPGLGLGLFLGRIGCFLAGCNGGVACGWPWAVSFPPGTSPFENQVALGYIPADSDLSLPAHPTQLYEAAFGLAAFFLLWRLLASRKWEGEVFLTGMIWYATFRFPSEWLRADGGGLHPLGILTFSQFVSLIVLTAALIAYYRKSKSVTRTHLARN
jgi:phosphatidylglycerol---prolipoprotein diacylglyceryl transferase